MEAAAAPRLQASVTLTVPFQDADPSGAAWHGNYFRYFDAARCALLDRLDYGYRAMAASGLVWPIVDTRVRFLRSVSFDQRLEVTASLEEWQYRLHIGYAIHDADGHRVTEGYTIQVPVDAATGEMCFGMPAALYERIDGLVRAALDE
ncbi:MAG: acyl-CoA thioesterase [Gammaproteobacteria bacterium]|nr:acyl-CoA thioesterase [Gammaproteobacteria bacterium]